MLEKITLLEQGDIETFEAMEQVVVESFDVVKKWLKKSLRSKIPCYTITDTEKELEVCRWLLKGTMSAGAHALSSPVGRFLRGVFLRRFV